LLNRVPVLVVGGGPVGLSTAITLARHGIQSLLVERRATTTDHPKARAVNLRTMELFRQWGVEDAVCDGALAQDFWRFIWCETLAGEEIARIETPDGQLTDKSPTLRRIVSQDVVERALYAHARELPLATLEFSTELSRFRQTEAGVEAELLDRESGETKTCLADYMVAADGAASSVRRELGITMEGPGELSRQLSVYFRADLTPWTASRPADIYYCTQGDWIAVVDGATHWLSIGRYEPRAEERARDLEAEELVARIRRSVGVDDLPVEVINASFWKMGAQAAARFRRGRVFLAGDAAHIMSPTGGFGMNTGIQDAHNLSWKLAAVLRGKAGPALLDTYESERKPVAESNAAWSAGNARRIWDILASVAESDSDGVRDGAREQLDHISSEGRALGFRYTSSAVVSDGSPAPPFSTQSYHPAAHPGCRAPHVWLVSNGTRVSTLDLLDRNLVLITSAPGDSWRAAVKTLQPSIRSYLELFTVGTEGHLQDPAETWLDHYGLERGGAVLVRPDGHVAWRAPTRPQDPAVALAAVLRCVLSLDTPGSKKPVRGGSKCEDSRVHS
jgi:putative polyketide hydroxylase